MFDALKGDAKRLTKRNRGAFVFESMLGSSDSELVEEIQEQLQPLARKLADSDETGPQILAKVRGYSQK